MYRYRENKSVTRNSLNSVEKHIAKIGKVKYIRAYVYQSNNIKKPAILVRGEKGTARFSGFSWGYNGEGVRGTKHLLQKLNISTELIEKVLSVEWDDKVKEYWRINLA